MSELKASKLKKRYKSRTVVQEVSLSVSSGEVVGLLGPNGAGKTTCFYMMVGLVPLDGGNIYLDELNLSQMPVHRRALLGLGYLPQEASIFRHLSVADNICAVLELQNYSQDEIQQHLDNLLDDLSISHLRANPALGLSGGERRRVEMKIIHFLKERDIGVLITDHNVRETLGICDRAYIISEGNVLASGIPDEIIYNENVRKVYLGEHFRL